MYFVLRATIGNEETANFFLSASHCRKTLPGEVFGEVNVDLGSLSRAFFVCSSKVWRICYLRLWSARGEKTGRMILGRAADTSEELEGGSLYVRGNALMRVLGGGTQPDGLRAELLQCLSVVAPFLPKAFLDRVGLPYDAEKTCLRQTKLEYCFSFAMDCNLLMQFKGLLLWAANGRKRKFAALLVNLCPSLAVGVVRRSAAKADLVSWLSAAFPKAGSTSNPLVDAWLDGQPAEVWTSGR